MNNPNTKQHKYFNIVYVTLINKQFQINAGYTLLTFNGHIRCAMKEVPI